VAECAEIPVQPEGPEVTRAVLVMISSLKPAVPQGMTSALRSLEPRMTNSVRLGEALAMNSPERDGDTQEQRRC